MSNVEFTASAVRHGITAEDAMYAIRASVVQVPVPGRDGHGDATLFIGHPHPQTGRWLEVIAEIRPPRGVLIFHAMELTDKFRHYLQEN